MIASRREQARLQSDFYREQFHKLLRWLIISIFIMFFLIAAIAYTFFVQPDVSYYADTIDGRILEMPKPTIS